MAKSLDFALCGVRRRGQIGDKREERIRLANEESHGSQELERSRRHSGRVRRTDHRTRRQARADEGAGFRHDQVRLKHLPNCGAFGPGIRIYATIEVGKCQPISWIGER